MKNISFKLKIALWTTLLITAVCTVSITGLIATSHVMTTGETKQRLISAVERNADEIEYKNGILEIENDFLFYSEGIYFDVYHMDNGGSWQCVDGKIPFNLSSNPNNGQPVKCTPENETEYYFYDVLINFNKYEYEIDAFSGQIIKYEAGSAHDAALTPKEYSAISFHNGINTEQAIEIALEHAGASKETAKIVNVELPGYSDRQVFSVEFTDSAPHYNSVFVRGLVLANPVTSVLGTVIKAIIYILPLFVILAAAGAYLLAKKTMKRVESISNSARSINDGKDLSQRIKVEGGNDEISDLADTFNSMLERLQTSFESEKQFTSDASHELRTPLAVIKAECEYAMSPNADSSEKEEAFVSINEQTDKMTRLVSALLSLTRAEQGTKRFRFELSDLSALSADICRSYKTEKNIQLHYNINSGIHLDMNADLIRHLLENLISNAVRYGKERGNIWVNLTEEDDKIILGVKDDGIGIKEDDLPKIWGRFYRADSSRSNSEGFGLGLALVERIAVLHNGKAEVKSVFGEGSEFTVTFFKKV